MELLPEPVGALEAAVKMAMERNTGARALRSIFEKAMLDALFEVPSRQDVIEVVVGAETISEGKPPRLISRAEKKAG